MSATHPRPAQESPADRVWFITGAGRGLGRAFAEAALGAGDRVVGTVRQVGALAELAAGHPGRVLEQVLDVREEAEVDAAVLAAIGWAGRLDVVVNNAGYGLVGTVEEVSGSEAEAIVGTNLLGPLHVCRAAIPHLRRQAGGHIVQISTSGAVGSMPALGLYNASKWGLEGFSEAMAAELAAFGIRVTIAELGGFDTDWAAGSMQFASPQPVYDELRAGLFGTADVPWPAGNADEGDDAAASGGEEEAARDAPAAVAAAALLEHLDQPEGPLRLLIGDDVADQVAMALDARRTDYAQDPRFTWPTA